MRYTERMLGDRDVAHDVAQEVFIRLWLKHHEWTQSGAMSAFLYRTAHNLAIDESRKDRTWRRGTVVRHASDDVRTPPTPVVELEQHELRAALERAVNALPACRREVFILYYFHNRSYRQIAEILGIKPQVVANYMSAALTELRQMLRPGAPRPVARAPSFSPRCRTNSYARIEMDSGQVWSPDGRHGVVSTFDTESKRTGLASVDLASGSVELLFEEEKRYGGYDNAAVIAPDGKSIVLAAEDASHAAELWLARAEKGAVSQQISQVAPDLARFELGRTGLIEWRSIDGIACAAP